MPHALVRGVPESFDRAQTREDVRPPHVTLARMQHEVYCRALTEAGYTLERVAIDETTPDCVFVEDTAVIVGSRGVITRPGSPIRRREVGPVADALGRHFELGLIEEPGTLDGGDVMILGDTVYVGVSERTNASGAEQLGAFAADHGLGLVTVPVSGVLHLKSAVLPIDEDTVVITPGTVDESIFAGHRVLHEDADERHRFSAVALESGQILVTDNAPQTAAAVAALGHEVTPLDVSEIQVADGGLTCMSILF